MRRDHAAQAGTPREVFEAHQERYALATPRRLDARAGLLAKGSKGLSIQDAATAGAEEPESRLMAPALRGTVIFDLDGTLVDSAPDLADSLDMLMAELGLAPFGLEATRTLIGHGIPALVRAALAARGVAADERREAEVVARFVVIYSGRLSLRTRAYEGADQALALLARAGWRLVVCTNKIEASARRILEDLGLAHRFAVIAGPDTYGVAKPDPGHLTGALPALARTDHPAVVVGDSGVDVAAARAAGLPIIAVSWGYARAPAAELMADAVADAFDQVPDLVEALAGRGRTAAA